MERIISELLSQSLNGVYASTAGDRPNRREEPEEDLRSFIRPTDTFEHNIQLLQLIQSIETSRYTYDVKRRQLRIVSDMMEDYQHNIQRFLQIVNLSTRSDYTQPRAFNRERRPVPDTAPRSTQGLTDRQVELATRTMSYDASMNEPRCPISLEDFADGEEIVQIIGCGHYFKCAALREWFNRNTQCPVCRYRVTNPTQTDSAPTIPADRTAADTWTSILAGLLTQPENMRVYTVEQEIVVPMTFDHQEEVD